MYLFIAHVRTLYNKYICFIIILIIYNIANNLVQDAILVYNTTNLT